MRFIIMPILVCMLSSCSSGGGDSSDSTRSTVEIPEKALWEAQMTQFGSALADRLSDTNGNREFQLAETFYDTQWVFFQIGDYTGDDTWYQYAQAAERVYRDYYVVPNDAFLPGFWLFPHGLAEDYLRTGDQVSRAALVGISTNGAFARDTTDPSETLSADFSRETAYVLHTYIQAERVGEPRRARLALLLEHALGHFDQWFGTRSAPFVRPFMVGLSAHALISYYEHVEPDGRILDEIKRAADVMWQEMWLEDSNSFMYTDRQTASGGQEPAPDLNLLIAPLYAWLYNQTGESKYQEQGDLIFRGGVIGAFLERGKQFNQNYRWSFEYLRYRSGS